MQSRLPKYYRSEATRQAVAHRPITDRDLQILETVGRFRLIPTSLLIRLLPGDRSVTYDRLKVLYHKQLVNRFHIPRLGPPDEFIYYLDNPDAGDILSDFGRSAEDIDLGTIQRNRENAYWRVNDPHTPREHKPGLSGIYHELMITRFQGCLELACQASGGTVGLIYYLRKKSVLKKSFPAPRMEYRVLDDGGEVWTETKDWSEWLTHNPDLFFGLHFLNLPEGDRDRYFAYEADRGTESVPRFAKKLRAHHQFILRQKHHQHIERKYGVKRVRAVVTETISDESAVKLCNDAATHPMIAPKPSSLFWFTTSRMFTDGPRSAPADAENDPYRVPYYLDNPQIIFHNIWATAVDGNLYKLSD